MVEIIDTEFMFPLDGSWLVEFPVLGERRKAATLFVFESVLKRVLSKKRDALALGISEIGGPDLIIVLGEKTRMYARPSILGKVIIWRRLGAVVRFRGEEAKMIPVKVYLTLTGKKGRIPEVLKEYYVPARWNVTLSIEVHALVAERI